MKDRRPVDDLSIEEIERVLAEKKRAAREARLAQYRATGRAVHVPVGEQPDAATPAGRAAAAPRSLPRRFFDWFLLVAEVGMVVGLVVVVFLLYQEMTTKQQVNQEMRNLAGTSTVPTPSPTPLVTVVVLPAGHTPPDATGASYFNEAEIPPDMLAVVKNMPPPAVPTQGPRQARRIVIPGIDVDARIVQGDSWEQLKQGVAQRIGTADPGQTGNLVLSAHNDVWGEIFKRLDELQPGDEVQIYTTGQIFTYVVTHTRIVEPTEVSVMDPTPYPSLTLISCYPYLVDTQRIVVQAELKTQ